MITPKPSYSILLLILLQATTASLAQKVVRYDLYIKDTLVNFAGKEKRAIAVNGQIPMPSLTFMEGDTAEIQVHNLLKEKTSLHWHGLFLPNKEDGVPYVTQKPIEPNTVHTYRFPVIQNGTHWYHSHSGLQEQLGMYGSLILEKRPDDPGFREGIDDLPAIPLILSEWTNLKPENVHRMLHNANDWFAIKKNATQSYAEAIRAGHFKTKLKNEWLRMKEMDVSDVYYDQFLINGKNESRYLRSFKAGDKVRLRVSNGGASSYFWLTYAGGKITVVANDGNDVAPVEVDRLVIGVSETYDVVVTIPAENTAYEFLATPEDRSKSASVFIGTGIRQLASRLPMLQYFEGMKMMNGHMKLNGDMDNMGVLRSLQTIDMNAVMYPEITGVANKLHGSESAHSLPDRNNRPEMKAGNGEHSDHNTQGKSTESKEHTGHTIPEQEKPDNRHAGHNRPDNSGIVTLNYAMLQSPVQTELPKDAPVREMQFELTGNMNRYVWSMDNKVLAETDKILIKKGEIVRITLYNNSMMRHPMHLHGHDFRLINGKEAYAPLKNVLDIRPMETDTIEFVAHTEGDWFFHCHILYHMMAGMNRVFSYETQAPNPLLPDKKWAYAKLQRESNRFHLMAENDFATNGNDGQARLQNTRWSVGSEWRLGYNKRDGYETETHVGRYLGKMQWLMPFIGFDWRYRKGGMDMQERNIFGQKNTKDQRALISAGISYTLPMLVRLQAELYADGNFRLQARREDIPLAKRIRADFMINTDKEYAVGLSYRAGRNIGLRVHYDSDMGLGAGLVMIY